MSNEFHCVRLGVGLGPRPDRLHTRLEFFRFPDPTREYNIWVFLSVMDHAEFMEEYGGEEVPYGRYRDHYANLLRYH